MAREGIRERCNLQTTKRTEEVESKDSNSSTGVWVVIIKYPLIVIPLIKAISYSLRFIDKTKVNATVYFD